jgi:hypothetical protein
MEVAKVAQQMAEDIVQAYIEHDGKNYEDSAQCFSLVFKYLFPRLHKDEILRAARAYASALKNHDLIEDGGHGKPAQLNHNGWKQVRNDLLEMSEALELPKDYASETTEFFRYHGVRDSEFVIHMLNSDKIFTSSILGDDNLSMILGGLYLVCVRCHDLHNDYGVNLGKKLIETYYSILLENMEQ